MKKDKKLKNFHVKSKHFSLLKAFKEEAEKLGYVYNEQFTKFSEDQLGKCGGINGLYFSSGWSRTDGGPMFALSYSSENVFSLETQFDEALAFAKKAIEDFKKPAEETLRLESFLDATVSENHVRIYNALGYITISVNDFVNILKAAEKTGLMDLIDEASEVHVDKW